MYAMIVQPLWWCHVGIGFVRGVGEHAAVTVEQVKAALWGRISRGRRAMRLEATSVFPQRGRDDAAQRR